MTIRKKQQIIIELVLKIKDMKKLERIYKLVHYLQFKT